MQSQHRQSPSSANLALEFVKVKKTFDDNMVSKNISLSVGKGETISILGPSGCGKTVALKMLIGLIKPDSGSIFFDGTDLASIEKQEDFSPIRKRISMVFQGAALFDSINVFENIAYPLRFFSNISEQEIEHRVHRTLSLVGLSSISNKMPNELSGGMKKRIGLARAIVTEPEIILYDEPNAGLDPINTTRIVDLILMLKENFGCTSLVVTHDMQVADRISDKVAFFYDGYVRKIGSMEEFRTSEDAVVRGFVVGDPDIFLTTFSGS